MENSNKKIACKDSSDKTIRRNRSEANGRCLEILLQHDLPEDLARSLVKDAADVDQLINTIQTVIPGAKDLLRALGELKTDEFSKEDRLLAVPKHKLPWFQVLLKHGVPQDIAATFVRDIVGGMAELADKLHDAMPEDADALLKQVFFPLCD